MIANSPSSSQRSRSFPGGGGGMSSNSKQTAPAHSPPILSSIAKSLASLIPRIAAIRTRGSASEKHPHRPA